MKLIPHADFNLRENKVRKEAPPSPFLGNVHQVYKTLVIYKVK
jgi:hypothetical protein